ncbi:putative clathrin assembly protein At5g35200 [Zea mays]|uniref:Putative clathrin assembly protein n=1 Tax=Zea mays TaxID=4577 RepID=K7W5Z1_MAIZE|nr:putative clathrin assembly protein At5g35200 [Zea mays]XP_008659224.1 putative clathrin assembly protein At5g35200 [Zea mays]XP_035818355.1 putative clathrin assembly protein At5g35200 [Zea mays]AQL01680.1 Putative clathrin assembly protein [Zea mays]|eukprot:XP_008659222.1 putative clathrin assembly protein At5g35200 [Zea mays]
MAVGGTQPVLRKYLGALKDTTTVSLAKVNSDYKELDIAIVKATNHVERPSKEKYIREIFHSISAARPRADVAYCIHALARRLSKTRNWAVALKTLIVIHRALREVDPTFREELLNYGRSRSHMLNMAYFKDDSSAEAWDYSAWVRIYALYLEERLECFRVLKYDVETDPPRTKDLDTVDLLDHLPQLQQLLFRLLACQPQGASSYNVIIQHALSMVALESVKIYTAISDGTINLVDKFFEMQRNDAVRALDVYKRATNQAERLSEFHEVCKTIHIGRGEKFLKIEQPPASFLQTMEDYVRDAPTGQKQKTILAIEYKKEPEEEEKPASPPPAPEQEPEQEPEPEPEPVKEEAPEAEPDLLGLNEPSPAATAIEEQNALALAIVPIDDVPGAAPTFENGVTGWELALVTAPSSTETAVAPSKKLAGGLDLLTLDSLYDEANRRASQPASYNPWDATASAPMMTTMAPAMHDPFYASNGYAAPHGVQMAAMAHHQQQQQVFMLQQQMMAPAPAVHHPMQMQQNPANPFGNPFAAAGAHPYGAAGMPLHAGPGNVYTGLI